MLSTGVVIEQYLSNRARGGRVVLQLELTQDGCGCFLTAVSSDSAACGRRTFVWRCLFRLIMGKSRDFTHLIPPIPCVMEDHRCWYYRGENLSCRLAARIHRACSIHRTLCCPSCNPTRIFKYTGKNSWLDLGDHQGYSAAGAHATPFFISNWGNRKLEFAFCVIRLKFISFFFKRFEVPVITEHMSCKRDNMKKWYSQSCYIDI